MTSFYDIIRQTLLRYVRLIAWAARLSVCLSVVCCRWCTLLRDLNFSALFLHHLIASRLGQFALKFWGKIEGVLGDHAS